MAATIVIFILLWLLEASYLRWAVGRGVVDTPVERSSHTGFTVRGGGVVFVAALWAWAVWSGFGSLSFLGGATLICAVAFADDLHPRSVMLRLAAQAAGVALMLADALPAAGVGWWLWPLAGVLFVAYINAYNFMDGINGSAVLYMAVLLLALLAAQPHVADTDLRLTVCMLAAAVVFGYYNVRTRARCFAGDVGAMAMGCVTGWLLLRLVIATSDLSWLALAAVYGVDAFLTIMRRLVKGCNIFQAHRMHAYQLLANEGGMGHLRVAILLTSVQAAIDLILITLPSHRLTVAVVSVVLLSIFYGLIVKRTQRVG